MSAGKHSPATMGGRCANGYERGQGQRVHAVPTTDELLRNGYSTGKAACGAAPGARSVGWSLHLDRQVSCPRCISVLAKAAGGAV